MTPHVGTRTTGFPIWRTIGFVLGLVLLVAGVVMHESGHEIGRILIVAGLPLAAAALILLALPQKVPPSVVELDTPETRMAALLAHVASHAGLSVHGQRLVGRFKDREVEASLDPVAGSVYARSRVLRHLDLGLTVRRGRPPGDARPTVSTGNEGFDQTYCVLVDEPERAQQLLTERLRQLLLGVDAELDDAGVHVTAATSDGKGALDAIRLAVKLAYEMERASSRARCAEPLVEAREAWLSFAREHKLASADTPLAMWGRVDGIALNALSVRDSFQHFHFELTAEFAAPLGRGFEIKPASASNQFDRSGEPVGHPAFDKVFIVKARDPQDAPRLVGPETRQALLELRDAGLQIRARDEGLWAWVALNRSDPERVPRGLERLRQIAARIAHNAERFPPRSG